MRVITVGLLSFVLSLAAPDRVLAQEGEPGAVETWPLEEIEEPSGINYHVGRRSLFVVSDEGGLFEVSTSGKLLASGKLGGDLEGVSSDPATGLVYVVREGHEVILEVDPVDLATKRRFTIDRSFGAKEEFLERGGDGIEGLTFVPSAEHPEGGRFFAVNQNDPAVLVELELPIRSSTERFATARVAAVFKVGSAPLSGVTWDPQGRRLLIVSALWRVAYMAATDGHYQGSAEIPGLMQEGIARLPDGSLVIAQDSGGLIRWQPVGKLAEGSSR